MPLIDLQDVRVVRDGNTILQIDRLTVQHGEHTAILGPNGCGKSTLIRLLSREIYPFAGQGTVTIDGRSDWLQTDLRQQLGIVSADLGRDLLDDFTGREMAVSGLLGSYGVTFGYDVTADMWDEADQSLAQVEAAHLASRTFASMSAGEQRRVLVARALVCKPKALVLDEPTTGLDLRARRDFLRTLGNLATSGTTLIMVTHHLEEVTPAFQRLIFLQHGGIVSDGNRDSLLNPTTLSDLFDVDETDLFYGTCLRV
jgi:iron complex transport system ATP-binding protein